ncbi:MAG: hypothetical protein IPL39_17180 [Opitutaceae bacterium]|nr:hypothetical protein [Opitutaceae bacterium]
MKNGSKTGSLLVTMLFVLAVLLVVGSILSMSLTSSRLSARNEFLARGRVVGESELEHLFYLFKDRFNSGSLPGAIPAELAGFVDLGSAPVTARAPYLDAHRLEGWTVRRSMQAGLTFEGVNPETHAKGSTTYVDVKLEITAPDGTTWAGARPVRYGRQFSTTVSTIFQNCIFYQGDLEMAPGGDTVITGDIVCNGSIYMGANGGGSLTLMKDVSYLVGHYFNYDPVAGLTTYRKPDTPTGGTLTAPTFFYSEAQQLKVMDKALNLLNGTDPVVIQSLRPDLYPTINDVYRSVIVPPPTALNNNEYTTPGALADDPIMGALRMHNRAGLIVTVDTGGAFTITKVQTDGTTTNVTTDMAGIVTGTSTMYDKREGRNVAVTEIDIGVLKGLVGNAIDNSATIYPDFNGLLYVNLKTGDSTSPSAVRLIHAEATPRTGTDDPVMHGTQGFSVATNGGLYVKGSYNTMENDGVTPIPAGASPPRSMLMGDAITVLSSGWDDANSNAGISARVASDNVTVNAGILVGNTAATASGLSGGVQNLVRYLEDWEAHSVTFTGSLGRLFDSKMFTRAYTQPSSGDIYRVPANRTFNFDEALTKGGGPPGSLKRTDIARGRFYYW